MLSRLPETLRKPSWLLAGSVAYLAIVFGVMLARGIEIEPQWVFLALLVLALAMGRGKQFIFDFVPFLVLFFAYEVMRGLGTKAGFPHHDLSGLERWLFAGQLPTLALQKALYRPSAISPLDWITMSFYFLHFVLPVAVGFFFWTRNRDHYWRFVAALLLMSFLAFVTFVLFPSTPPWLQFPHDVVKVSDATVHKWGISYYQSPIYNSLGRLDPNLYAAFPSMHAAFPSLCAVYAWSNYRRLAVLLIAYTGCVWFSVAYLGEHYIVDALAALLYVAVATVAVTVVARIRQSALSQVPTATLK